MQPPRVIAEILCGLVLTAYLSAGCREHTGSAGVRTTASSSVGLPDIVLPQNYRAARVSSNDATGGNVDNHSIAPGETLLVADLQGPGLITHCWFTISSEEPTYLSNLVLQIRWDDAAEPAVDSPIGPFFALGHNEIADVVSAPIAVMAGRATYIKYPPGLGALNCYFAMPFRRRARIEVVNRGSKPVRQFFYHVDWRTFEELPPDARYFHARYRTENTAVDTQPEGRNLGGESNYVILDAAGAGHYVGCTLHVEARASEAGKWYEGDEFIQVDGESVKRAMLGTGTEDYFNMAWGVRRVYQAPFFGASYVSWNPGEPEMLQYGRFSVYRWHLPDPIPFARSIRVSIEHGHDNDAANRYASVAYWYAAEP